MKLHELAEAARTCLVSSGAEAALICLKSKERTAVSEYAQGKHITGSALSVTMEITAEKGGRSAFVKRSVGDGAEAAALAREAAEKLSVSEEPADGLAPVLPQSFSRGKLSPEPAQMEKRVCEFMSFLKSEHPSVVARVFSLIHERGTVLCCDLAGNTALDEFGCYQIDCAMTAVNDTVSTTYTGFGTTLTELSAPLSELFSLRDAIRMTEKQLDPPAAEKPRQNIVVFAPGCQTMLWYQILSSQLSDFALRSGSSALASKFGEVVFDPALTVRSAPVSDGFAGVSCLDDHGAVKQDSVLIENGRLCGTMLSPKCAAELGLPVGCEELCFSVLPGEKGFDELIADIESGILVNRLSGGSPTLSGDISMLAKCSFLIENGRVTRPIEGVSISGNLLKALRCVDGLSSEVTDMGSCRFPYLRLSGLSLS